MIVNAVFFLALISQSACVSCFCESADTHTHTGSADSTEVTTLLLIRSHGCHADFTLHSY